MSQNILALFYLVSGVLFILALRGLSSPETSRQGNLFGIIGMAIAIGVTILSIGNFSLGFVYLLVFMLIGGSIGAFIAFKIPMTAMPELVAGFHSLVGLAAVFVAISAFINPEVFKLGFQGNITIRPLDTTATLMVMKALNMELRKLTIHLKMITQQFYQSLKQEI